MSATLVVSKALTTNASSALYLSSTPFNSSRSPVTMDLLYLRPLSSRTVLQEEATPPLVEEAWFTETVSQVYQLKWQNCLVSNCPYAIMIDGLCVVYHRHAVS